MDRAPVPPRLTPLLHGLSACAVAALLAACGKPEAAELSTRLTSLNPPAADGSRLLYVADHQVPCATLEPQTCLLVREDPRAEWQPLYEAIEGFSYQPGHSYTLRVQRDGGAGTEVGPYRLVAVQP